MVLLRLVRLTGHEIACPSMCGVCTHATPSSSAARHLASAGLSGVGYAVSAADALSEITVTAARVGRNRARAGDVHRHRPRRNWIAPAGMRCRNCWRASGGGSRQQWRHPQRQRVYSAPTATRPWCWWMANAWLGHHRRRGAGRRAAGRPSSGWKSRAAGQQPVWRRRHWQGDQHPSPARRRRPGQACAPALAPAAR